MSKKTSKIPLSMNNLEEVAQEMFNKKPMALANAEAMKMIADIPGRPDSIKWDFNDAVLLQSIKIEEQIVRKIFEYASTEEGAGFKIPYNSVLADRRFRNKVKSVFDKENVRIARFEIRPPLVEENAISIYEVIGLIVGKRFYFLVNDECYYVYMNEDVSIPKDKCNSIRGIKAEPPKKWYDFSGGKYIVL